MKRILPEGYYTNNESNPYLVTLNMGPYKGLKIQVAEKIKIIPVKEMDYRPGQPQFCYDYRILHYAGHNPRECEKSKALSRIVAAIALELVCEQEEGWKLTPQENNVRH
jgi:hypothetical protein